MLSEHSRAPTVRELIALKRVVDLHGSGLAAFLASLLEASGKSPAVRAELQLDRSCGPGALCELGFAHVLNGQPEKAIALLAESHRKEPWVRSVQRVILEALFAQGKDETAFDWRELMPVFRLDSSVLDRCHEILSSSW